MSARSALLNFNQFAVPLALAYVVIRPASAASFTATAVLLTAYVAYIVLVGRWTPRAMLAIPMVSLLAIPFGLARLAPAGEPGSLSGADLLTAVLSGALPVFFLIRTWHALQGRTAIPGAAIDLTLPLGPGQYLAVQAGSRRILNAHLACLDEPRLHQIRGQSFGVDIVGLNRWGMTVPVLRSRQPQRYAIFGRSVLAPIDATAARVVDGFPDLPPPEADHEHPMGNHIWLEADGPSGRIAVLLAHLRCNSISVEPGSTVSRGQKVAEVGNSGNTSEPHLHIHAQSLGNPPFTLSAQPVPLNFAGLGHLSRGRRFAGGD